MRTCGYLLSLSVADIARFKLRDISLMTQDAKVNCLLIVVGFLLLVLVFASQCLRSEELRETEDGNELRREKRDQAYWGQSLH